jgi:hypothetical protein
MGCGVKAVACKGIPEHFRQGEGEGNEQSKRVRKEVSDGEMEESSEGSQALPYLRQGL